MCSTGFARSHNPPRFTFPGEISSPFCRARALRNLSLLLSYLKGKEKKKKEIGIYATSVSSCSTFLFSSGVTQRLPRHSPSPAVQSRGWGAQSVRGLAWESSRARGTLLSARRGEGSLHAIPASAGWGDNFLSSNSQRTHTQSRLPGACQNLPKCHTEPALLAAGCWNKLKRRGKVIKISFINTTPRGLGEAEVLSDHVITTALLLPNLEEILPKSTTAPSPAPLSILSCFYFAP